MNRIIRLVPKGHGARLIFILVALLGDCFFMVNKADVEAIEHMLANQGKSAAEIEMVKDKDWTFFIRNARRRVPEAEVLLRRFDAVIKACKDIRDAKTGQVLLSPAAMNAVFLIRQHIELGCLSDPPGVPLYFQRGKTLSGLPIYRCVRGTNATEVGGPCFLQEMFVVYDASNLSSEDHFSLN